MIFIFLLALTFVGYLFVICLKEKMPKDLINSLSSYSRENEEITSYNVRASEYNNILKKVRVIYPVAASLIWLTFLLSCFETVKPGEVGVVVNMLGETKGAEDLERTVGIYFIPPWKSMYHFPIFEQNHVWDDAFNFQTSEGLPVIAHIGITYHLLPTKIHNLFSRYRRGMEEITHLFIKNNLRDYINRYASKMKIEDLIGSKKEDFFKDVKEAVQQELCELGFIITHVYAIGEFHIPQNVKEALNDKIAATQRAQQRENELREAEAQARKMVAQTEGEAKSRLIKADADAKANDKLAKSITKELLEWNAINKWDGKMPYALSGQGMPFILPLANKDK